MLGCQLLEKSVMFLLLLSLLILLLRLLLLLWIVMHVLLVHLLIWLLLVLLLGLCLLLLLEQDLLADGHLLVKRVGAGSGTCRCCVQLILTSRIVIEILWHTVWLLASLSTWCSKVAQQRINCILLLGLYGSHRIVSKATLID